METKEELDIIAHTRNEIHVRQEDTGRSLFLIWGYPTAICFLAEFAVLMLWGKDITAWLWIVIPLIGMPLMMIHKRRDYERTGRRTLNESYALQLWMFLGAASAVSGFTLGITDIYSQCYCTIQGLIIATGCFVTGELSRHRPMKLCSIVGAIITFACPFLQGNLWPWQLVVAACVTIIALIIPGHMLLRKNKHEKQEDSNTIPLWPDQWPAA